MEFLIIKSVIGRMFFSYFPIYFLIFDFIYSPSRCDNDQKFENVPHFCKIAKNSDLNELFLKLNKIYPKIEQIARNIAFGGDFNDNDLVKKSC